MQKEIKIPEISENVTSGSVVEVLVEVGSDVEVDDPIIEFETDKAVVEIPSPYKGRIAEILAKEGDEMNVGDVVAKIETEPDTAADEAPADKDRHEAREHEAAEDENRREEPPREKDTERKEDESRQEPAEKEKERAAPAEPEKAPEDDRAEPAADVGDKPFRKETDDSKRAPVPASPSVRRIARELGVDIHDVRAAGPGDRISEDDVKAYAKKAMSASDRGSGAAGVVEPPAQRKLPDFRRWGEVETRELSSVRRLTAESMSAAWQSVVHVTQFERVDITAVEEFINRHAGAVADQGGKLTITAVLMKVCAAALKRFPRFNATIDPANNQLIIKKYVHVGLAVDTSRGLLVPVVRDADRKPIQDLAVEIVDLARRARNKKIKPDEMEGGTFTISNQGGIGGTDFTPVVFWPQAAILGVSRSSIEPRYMDGEFLPRTILPLALSYDHRIIDGADAARFVGWIRESIEHPLTMHLD